MRIAVVLGTLLAAAVPAAAQRALPVPSDKGWKHADSGIILTATLAGLPRTSLADLGEAERDVVAEFSSPDKATIATIYVFHPGLMSVPVWFDRAQWELETKQVYGGVRAASTEPAAFSPPGIKIAAGLRQTYRTLSGPYRATALAVTPVGEWLVAVRLSSKTLDAVTIDPELTNILTAIRWPTPLGTPVVAVPVGICADALTFTKAKMVQADMMQALLGSTMAGAALKSPSTDATPWCRDPFKPTAIYGVYRRVGSRDGYTLAIADSGRAAGVYKAFSLPDQPSSGGYSVSFSDLDGSVATFPSFATLPQPDQVAQLVLRGQATARTVVKDGKTNVTIGVPK